MLGGGGGRGKGGQNQIWGNRRAASHSLLRLCYSLPQNWPSLRSPLLPFHAPPLLVWSPRGDDWCEELMGVRD